MIAKLKKIISMPPKIVLGKIYRRCFNKMYYHYRKIQLNKIGVNIDDSAFSNWESDIKFVFDEKNKSYYVNTLKEIKTSEIIVLQAEKICNRTFNLLGSGDYKFEDGIKWGLDFKSGFVWEYAFYKDIKTIDLTNSADVKVPWELSRFQHLTVLGQAYWITSDEKYSKEFEHQINDWILNNPLEYSVNWTCAMDVAIRACNWIVGYMYFNNSLVSEGFWLKFNKSLFFHGDYIYKNLEKGYPSNNHYLSNLVGLIWVGLYFKNLNYKSKKINKWLNFALKELELEMDKQVYDDGFNFEASTAYHCLTTELILYTSIFCNKNGIEFSKHFNSKLEKMCEVIMNIIKPNGLIPLIGDMDSGRFIMFTGYGDEEMRDFRYLLGVAGEYFDRDDFRYHALNQLAAIWMLPNIKLIKGNNHSLKSVTYPEGGIHILRNDEVYLAVRCGQNGTSGKGGHTHNDQLSFELNIKGEDFIIDPGTYVYTSNYEMRNLFRSTEYHNTLQLDNLEQNEFNAKDLFFMQDQTEAHVIDFDISLFSGKHFGFVKDTGLIHQRDIELQNKKILICDKLVPVKEKFKTEATPKVNFIFHEEVILKEYDDRIILTKNNMSIELILDSGYEIEKVFTANKYGSLKESNRLVITINGEKSEIIIDF